MQDPLYDARALLARYASPESRGWAERAAADAQLRTADLLTFALEEVREHRASDDAGRLPALVVLHARSDTATRLAALSLLQSVDPSERELAALLMREFGPPHVEPRSHAREFLPALVRAVDAEDDTSALVWQLSAIGWQGLPEALPVLLRFARHQHASVREMVGGQLRNLSLTPEGLSHEVAMALLEHARDQDAHVAWSVLYDVADTPELFVAYRDEFREAARDALDADDAQLRDIAAKALSALESMTGEDR